MTNILAQFLSEDWLRDTKKKKGELTKHSNEKNATQISRGKTEQQIGETTKRSTASEQAVDQQIGPRTDQLWTEAGEPQSKHVLEQPYL